MRAGTSFANSVRSSDAWRSPGGGSVAHGRSELAQAGRQCRRGPLHTLVCATGTPRQCATVRPTLLAMHPPRCTLSHQRSSATDGADHHRRPGHGTALSRPDASPHVCERDLLAQHPRHTHGHGDECVAARVLAMLANRAPTTCMPLQGHPSPSPARTPKGAGPRHRFRPRSPRPLRTQRWIDPLRTSANCAQTAPPPARTGLACLYLTHARHPGTRY